MSGFMAETNIARLPDPSKVSFDTINDEGLSALLRDIVDLLLPELTPYDHRLVRPFAPQARAAVRHGRFSAPQLKIIQEVITLVVFCGGTTRWALC